MMTLNISRLSDHELLASAKDLAYRERSLNLRIIEHLREIGSRGLHLRNGYGSLFDYAVKELGFGEGSAYQRLQSDAADDAQADGPRTTPLSVVDRARTGQVDAAGAGADRGVRSGAGAAARSAAGAGKRAVGAQSCN